MNAEPQEASSNTAVNVGAAGSSIGIQATVVHNPTIFQVDSQATPQSRYDVGLAYLDAGVPVRAEENIAAAIAAGCDGPEARFHWMLAIMSKRSYYDLSRAERERLNDIANCAYPSHSEYRAGLDAIAELLCHRSVGGNDANSAEKKILTLSAALRGKIEHHLDQVLSKAIKDKLWDDATKQAKADRYDRDRLGRMWAYFHPKPRTARAWKPSVPRLTEVDWFRARAATVLFAVAAGYLAWLTVSSLNLVSILAFHIALAAGYFGAGKAFTWRYCIRRINAEEFKYFGYPAIDHLRGKRFTKHVSRSFEYCFAKYRPGDVDPGRWLDETAGIRGWLRREIAELYRESTVRIEHVNWLIRFLARDVRSQHKRGTLFAYRVRYHVDSSTKVQCVLLAVCGIAVAIPVIATVIEVAKFYGVVAVISAAASGTYAARRWEHIESEKRRFVDETAEYQKELSKREAEYDRWSQKLESTRPDEREMETWLNADKALLIAETLQHYRLSWSDLATSALLQGPAKGCKRGRVNGGPWRYSRYDLRLFLITEDGVREVITCLDFENSKFNGGERNNYRFEALSSVSVTENHHSRTLNLTLSNGPLRSITVADSDEADTPPDAAVDEQDRRTLALDPAGFSHALRMLEGIAAEGKGWIKRGDPSQGDPP